jgi:hypothetical protein
MANGIKLLRGTVLEHINYTDFENGELTAITTDAGVSTGELRMHTGDGSEGILINTTAPPVVNSSGNNIISESNGSVNITASHITATGSLSFPGLSPTVASIALGG